MLKGVGNRLAYGLFPGICLCCGLDAGRGLDLCQGCEETLPEPGHRCLCCGEPLAISSICGHCLREPPAFSAIRCCFLYRTPVDSLITRLKRGGDLSVAPLLAALMARRVESQDWPLPDVIAPMPLHWRRRLARGFNQALEIARPLARTLEIPLDNKLVSRPRHSAPQQTMNRRRRLHNLRGAFKARIPCPPLRIAVVDDVVTTGATARSVAAALMAAGAGEVEIWGVARTALEN